MDKMSEFYAKVMSDEKAKAKLMQILKGKDIASDSDEELSAIAALASEMHFDVSLDDVKEYLQSEESELDDEALDAVAGGIVRNTPILGRPTPTLSGLVDTKDPLETIKTTTFQKL